MNSSDIEKLKSIPIDTETTVKAGKAFADAIKSSLVLAGPGVIVDILRRLAVMEAKEARWQLTNHE